MEKPLGRSKNCGAALGRPQPAREKAGTLVLKEGWRPLGDSWTSCILSPSILPVQSFALPTKASPLPQVLNSCIWFHILRHRWLNLSALCFFQAPQTRFCQIAQREELISLTFPTVPLGVGLEGVFGRRATSDEASQRVNPLPSSPSPSFTLAIQNPSSPRIMATIGNGTLSVAVVESCLILQPILPWWLSESGFPL